MKLLSFTLVALSALLVGCGGHSGGTLDIPLDQNPYQVSDSEQAAMDGSNQVPEVFLETEEEDGTGDGEASAGEPAEEPKQPKYYDPESQ
ncbi:MAG: hypothetical protein AAFX06_27555 [Planctomycetota bacterium]